MRKPAGRQVARLTAAATPATPEIWPLIGRDAEVAQAVALLRTPASKGVAIHGEPGTGRSRLATEILAELQREGSHRVLRAVANESASTIPLGALAHLLPPGMLVSEVIATPLDPVGVLAQASLAMSRQGPAVLAIDDAHLLDAFSITLLHQLVDADAVRLLLTARGGEPEPEGLSALWRTGRIGRIDLVALDAPSVASLLEAGLGGAVDGRAVWMLNEASAGVPLLLRELVRSALDQGALVFVDGVWRLEGALPAARRAVELVAGELSRLSAEPRQLLELLVLAGETPLDLIDATAPPRVLEHLEQAGYVAVRAGHQPGDPYSVVVLRHVVIDAVRAGLSPLRTRNLLRSHADRYAAWCGGTATDRLRIAGWRLEAGVAGDPETLEQRRHLLVTPRTSRPLPALPRRRTGQAVRCAPQCCGATRCTNCAGGTSANKSSPPPSIVGGAPSIGCVW